MTPRPTVVSAPCRFQVRRRPKNHRVIPQPRRLRAPLPPPHIRRTPPARPLPVVPAVHPRRWILHNLLLTGRSMWGMPSCRPKATADTFQQPEVPQRRTFPNRILMRRHHVRTLWKVRNRRCSPSSRPSTIYRSLARMNPLRNLSSRKIFR